MRKATIGIGLVLLSACSKSGSTNPSNTTTKSDTTFSGSYIQLNYNGNSYMEKEQSVAGALLVSMSTALYISPIYEITEEDNASIGNLAKINILFTYTGTGTGSFPVYGQENSVIQYIPSMLLQDTTGTITITYSGTDYIQGTINTTMYSSGQSYPTTGSFKIYH